MIKLILPLVLIVGIIGGVYLVQNRVNLFPHAAETMFQEKIVISNLAPTSLAITYFTPTPTYDFIQYGVKTDVPNSAYDARMKDGLNPQLQTHYFRIKNLKPNTLYYFKINSDGVLRPGNSLGAAASSAYLSFKTPKGLRGKPTTEFFKGTVKKSESGAVPREGIIFLSSDNGQLLSTPMKENGDWAIGFRGMRTADMTSYFKLIGTDQIRLMAYAARDGFGMFGEYSFKRQGIDIETTEGRLPFYKILVNLPENTEVGGVDVTGEVDTTAGNSNGGESNFFWIIIEKFFKF